MERFTSTDYPLLAMFSTVRRTFEYVQMFLFCVKSKNSTTVANKTDYSDPPIAIDLFGNY